MGWIPPQRSAVQECRTSTTRFPWMTRSELVARLSEANPHLDQRDVEAAVAAIFDEIATAMENGARVELRGFGTFSVRRRDARPARNPRSGDSVQVPEKHVPFFKAGKPIMKRLNSG
jgi:integration host factor subunit beta